MKLKLLIFLPFILFTSCEEWITYSGDVFIQNSTGGPIWATVSYSLSHDEDPRYLYYNAQTGFEKNYGVVYAQVCVDGKLWYFWDYFLEAGEVIYLECIIDDEGGLQLIERE